jgi:hypothetical protein
VEPGRGDGPFTPGQLHRLDRSLTAADHRTGLRFSVYIGELRAPTHRAVLGLLDGMGSDARRSVVVAVSPEQRVVEVVTGTDAKRYLPDRTCGLAVASMVSAFAQGDLIGGLVSGVDLMRDQASRG